METVDLQVHYVIPPTHSTRHEPISTDSDNFGRKDEIVIVGEFKTEALLAFADHTAVSELSDRIFVVMSSPSRNEMDTIPVPFQPNIIYFRA